MKFLHHMSVSDERRRLRRAVETLSRFAKIVRSIERASTYSGQGLDFEFALSLLFDSAGLLHKDLVVISKELPAVGITWQRAKVSNTSLSLLKQDLRKLKRDFRYGSLAVVESRRMRLAINEVGKLELPNGRKLQIMPLLLDDRGVLMAVDLEGVLQTDLRVKSGHLVVFGAHRHGPDRLVIAVTPHL